MRTWYGRNAVYSGDNCVGVSHVWGGAKLVTSVVRKSEGIASYSKLLNLPQSRNQQVRNWIYNLRLLWRRLK